ncbi:SDR family NAD(P)-dependent oxidoreductase [Dyella caseinilytica]|uniref:SDR family oxidoreductase n=1 Tax=Dyella caseinilytica TaxID=1849581 RepID=A0ABX7GQE2_9GAMM|nr:SDR family oxidoreductase [Dyella caseinilytica]QRN52276.1 SDR family oxidoreductase [Dyella caseinilytica]GGA14543.1 3-oxoacyl-ACP reductase [Dyella caseinilytica]
MPSTPTPFPFDLSDYRIVIAGGSKGIGRSMALAFAASGAAVSICARGQAALDETAKAIAAHGVPVHQQSCNLGNASAIDAYINAAAETLGGIDVLINNASGYGFQDTEEDWAAVFNIDMMAAVRASRAAMPYLEKSSHPSILHTSSIAGMHPRPHMPSYGAMKAALCHYTTSQALALAVKRIRVNAIAPGSIEFEGGMWDRCKREDPTRYAAVLSKIPFGRYGTPEEIAHVALFLASPWAGWITGQILCVDGGQQLT